MVFQEFFSVISDAGSKKKNHTRAQMWRHNMVAIQKSGIFVLPFLYPRFCPILFGVNSSGTHCSVRQGQGASHVSKWQMCITRIEVNFPLKVKRPIRFWFRDQVCFSTSLLTLMYLSIFVRVAKNLALYPRFMLSIQHVSIVVHNLWKKCIRYFYSQCAFNNVGHIWLMSSSRC